MHYPAARPPAPRTFIPPHSSPVTTERWQACWEGHEPAEILDQAERELLVAFLHDSKLTDREIAAHTRMTLYTTARIRERLDLPPNPEGAERGSATLSTAELRALRERYRMGEPVHRIAYAYAMEPRDVRHLTRDLLSPTDFEHGRITSSRPAPGRVA